MTMIITEELIKAVLEDGALQLEEDGIVELFETNTSLSRICLHAEQEDDIILYHVTANGEQLCTTSALEVAALVFNYFGTKA